MPSPVLSRRGELAAHKRHHPNADDSQLRQALKAACAEDYTRKLVDDAPPLTAEQRDRLAVLLRPARSGGDRTE